MKNVIPTLILSFIASYVFGQVAFVNEDATGLNDGTSWENAYVSLHSALSDDSANELWLINGIYTSELNPLDSMTAYLIDRNVAIYGGFVGTETSKDQRDTDNSNTVISGDKWGNDGDVIDQNTRFDNDRHVLFVMPNLTNVILDNLTINGGNTVDIVSVNISRRSGGGIYSLSALTITNCTFTNNFGRSGAGLCINNEAGLIDSTIVISNCTFDRNQGSTQSAGAIFLSCDKVEVTNSEFINNITNRGCCYPVECNTFSIDSCSFSDNINPDGFGGGLFTWQTRNVEVKNSEFSRNLAESAGGIYFDTRELMPSERSITVENCSFNNNMANSEEGGFGGAIYAWMTNISILNSVFIANESTETAGGIYVSGEGSVIQMTDLNFENNSALFGGALASYGDISTTLNNSTFLSNFAVNGGGAINNGFRSALTIDSVFFQRNDSGFGGAVTMQNDSTALSVLNSTFDNNTANSGGALGLFGTTNASLNIFNSSFENNSADTGGSVFLQGHAGSPRIPFNLERTTFQNNTAGSQGGAINVSNAEGTFLNCLIADNEAMSTGTGGAISLNADSLDTEIILQHCTIVENIGELSSGLAAWGIGGEASIRLRNTILDNDRGDDFAVEDGRGRFISDGGNYIGSPNLLDSIDMDLDIFDFSPILVDKAAGDFALRTGSVAIDNGLAMWSNDEDLNGDLRDGTPDIGCFEFEETSDVSEVIILNELNLYPNPVSNILSIPTDINNIESYSIYNHLGGLVISKKQKASSIIDVSNLAEGLYTVTLNNKKETYVGKFIKQ